MGSSEFAEERAEVVRQALLQNFIPSLSAFAIIQLFDNQSGPRQALCGCIPGIVLGDLGSNLEPIVNFWPRFPEQSWNIDF